VKHCYTHACRHALHPQSLLDGTAAYALHMTAIFIAIGPPFFGRDFFALTLDFIAT
jgi:hypothetical protein